MDSHGMLAGVLSALHNATLHDDLWPHTSALIDEACGATGNAIVVSEGFGENARVHYRAAYYRGVRNEELEEDYFRNYHYRDERVPRLWRLPDSLLVHVSDLYTEQEKKTSPAYNEALVRIGDWNGLAVRLDGPDGTRITWNFANPSQPGSWATHQIEMIERLIPHIRKFVQVRQALASAQALSSSLSDLLDNNRVGIIQLDRGGRILEANDRALEILRRDDGLHDQNGVLEAWLPSDNARLQKLLAGALPSLGGHAAAGSMTIRCFGGARKLMLYINPAETPPLDFGVRRVAALVLLTEPAGRPRLDAKLVADVLGLTAAESQVAVMLSEGMSASDIAMKTGRQASTVNTLIQRAYRKLGISRQTELMRLVFSLADASTFRPL